MTLLRKISLDEFLRLRRLVYRNARSLDYTKWKFLFENGSCDISYLGKAPELFAETFLERAYLLDGRIFGMQSRECFRRNATKVYRKPRLEKAVIVNTESI